MSPPLDCVNKQLNTPCWICGDNHKPGHCRRSEAVAKLSEEMLARWIFKHISFKEPREQEVEFLTDVLREHWRQAQNSAKEKK